MKKRKFVPQNKIIFIFVLVIVGISLFCYSLRIMLNTNYFNVKEIISNEKSFKELAYLKGRNIFGIDLPREARTLSYKFPDYRTVRLIRVLPDTLFIEFVKRQPVAFVKLYRMFCLDKDYTLFDCPLVFPEMPIITGLENKIFGVKPGSRYDLPEIKVALNIIKEYYRSRAMRIYRIARMDFASGGNISLYLSMVNAPKDEKPIAKNKAESLLEVKISDNRIKDKISILNNLLVQFNSDRFNIKYVDLRFKEPVVKFNDPRK